MLASPRSTVTAVILYLCKIWDFLLLFSGLENASWLVESRIPRKAAVGVRVRVSQSAPHSGAVGLVGASQQGERKMLN